MTKKCHELYEKAKRNPSGLKFTEIQKLCLCVQMEHIRTRGSHYIYRSSNPSYLISLREMASGMAKPYQVRELIDFIEDNGLHKIDEQ
jgi:hypothetical protein